mgnify:CR=1 FL=1
MNPHKVRAVENCDRECRSQLMHCLLAGRTAVGERVWDLQRLLDWAVTLPGADSRRVLMMGNSGGGMVTMFAAACGGGTAGQPPLAPPTRADRGPVVDMILVTAKTQEDLAIKDVAEGRDPQNVFRDPQNSLVRVISGNEVRA